METLLLPVNYILADWAQYWFESLSLNKNVLEKEEKLNHCQIKTKEKVLESELDNNINSGQGLSKLQANQAYSQNTNLINQSSVPV